jgi:hypothetical protein
VPPGRNYQLITGGAVTYGALSGEKIPTDQDTRQGPACLIVVHPLLAPQAQPTKLIQPRTQAFK